MLDKACDVIMMISFRICKVFKIKVVNLHLTMAGEIRKVALEGRFLF